MSTSAKMNISMIASMSQQKENTACSPRSVQPAIPRYTYPDTPSCMTQKRIPNLYFNLEHFRAKDVDWAHFLSHYQLEEFISFDGV
ncbi:hypothetical protein Y032_0016g3133 [Ancylostoma ceylanicum]|uniref:Uncharacterized protein n=1 Tax=Ancylostoma ceylanicum TaxID=53326 RepID=A0A016V6S4_9BILA|nr:hypothetical protein Y032_0016g3133 [Ancylostoma ceylanicum]